MQHHKLKTAHYKHNHQQAILIIIMPKVGRVRSKEGLSSMSTTEDVHVASTSTSGVSGEALSPIGTDSETPPVVCTTTQALEQAYTAPQWLLQEKQTPKSFSVPLPSAPKSTLLAVKRYIKKNTPVGESKAVRKARKQTAAAMDKWRRVQQDHKTQKQRLKFHKERLSSLTVEQEESMSNLRKDHEGQVETALGVLKATLQAAHDKRVKEDEDRLVEQIKQEFEKELAAKREAELKEKKQEEEKKGKEEEEEEEGEEKEEGEEPDDEEGALAAKRKREAIEAKEPQEQPVAKKSKKSDLIQAKVDDCQTRLDKHHEQKSEMVWLLKQVIKADAKRKAELVKLKAAQAAKDKAAGLKSGD